MPATRIASDHFFRGHGPLIGIPGTLTGLHYFNTCEALSHLLILGGQAIQRPR
jgi:hypothetical protein